MQSASRQESEGRYRGLRRVLDVQQWGIVSVLVVLVVILGITVPVFLSPRNLRNVLQQISTLGVLSMGMTVLMISGGIDLSVGSSISVTAVTLGVMLKSGAPVMGLLNGLLAAYTKAHPFILTLGTMQVFQGVAIVITGGYPITDLGDRFEFIGGGMIGGVPFIVIIFFAVLLVCFFLLRYTRMGRLAYAIGGNEYTTYLAGIKVRLCKILFYVIAGFCAGLAAIVLSSRISSAIPTMGAGFELNSIAAVVIGGTPLVGGRGNVWGTLTGVLLLGIISNGLNLLHVEGSWQYVVTGAIIIIAVIMHESRRK
jgi:ribose transport system permease protein